MTKASKTKMARLVRYAKQINPGISQREAERLARRVARSLAKRDEALRAARG